MSPELRRIIAAEAHRRATGHCPVLLHALGTGESFPMRCTADGFTDAISGLVVCAASDGTLLIGTATRIVLTFDDAVLFRGQSLESGERFTGRAGGGASVTLYGDGGDYFQYAIIVDQAAA